MAEPLKDIYFTRDFVQRLGQLTRAEYAAFDVDRFEGLVFDSAWRGLELKQRMRKVSSSLAETLPADYPEALRILTIVGPSFSGFDAMVFPDFVECYGLGHWALSMGALKKFTLLCSSEFAVRPFIAADPDRAFKTIRKWAQDTDEQVRRLASEGCRPRLPWAMSLPDLKEDPSPILPILEKLKDDDSESVRRSVANNLNDISKDHPDLVLDVCSRWLGTSERTNRVVKHACRTLLKAGNTRAMRLFGFGDPDAVLVEHLDLANSSMAVGAETTFSFRLIVTSTDALLLRLEYEMDYAKANGRRSRKVFQIREAVYEPGVHELTRKLSFVDRSTRKHYGGEHTLRIIVNGVRKARKTFDVTRE